MVLGGKSKYKESWGCGAKQRVRSMGFGGTKEHEYGVMVQRRNGFIVLEFPFVPLNRCTIVPFSLALRRTLLK